MMYSASLETSKGRNGACHWYSGKRICLPKQEMQETRVWSWVGSRKWQPSPVFLPGKFHGRRSQAGYTVHGVTKSWTWLSMHTGKRMKLPSKRQHVSTSKRLLLSLSILTSSWPWFRQRRELIYWVGYWTWLLRGNWAAYKTLFTIIPGKAKFHKNKTKWVMLV